MLKCLFVILLISVSAQSTPIDNSQNQKSTATEKVNTTDVSSQTPKQNFNYGINSVPFWTAGVQPYPFASSMMSSPYAYSSALPYSYSSSQPAVSYSNYHPLASSLISTSSNQYVREQAPQTDMKTVSHLRPQLYGAQMQPLVIVPTSSYASQHIYQQPYSHSGYGYSGYPSYSYGGYDSYSSLYKRENEEGEMNAINAQQTVRPAVNYQTTYIMKQPEVINDQPLEFPSYRKLMVQTPAARSALEDERTNIVALDVIPTRGDMAIDEKLQLKFSPDYLMHRLDVPAFLTSPTSHSKAAADEMQYSYPPNVNDAEDRVYIQYNPNQPENVQSQVARAANEISPSFYPSNQMISSPSVMSYNVQPFQAGYNSNKNAMLPFSQEQILAEMEQYYNKIYQQRLEEFKRYYSPEPVSKQSGTLDVTTLSKVIEESQNNKQAKSTENIKKPVDDLKKNEVVKDEKSPEPEQKKQ